MNQPNKPGKQWLAVFCSFIMVFSTLLQVAAAPAAYDLSPYTQDTQETVSATAPIRIVSSATASDIKPSAIGTSSPIPIRTSEAASKETTSATTNDAIDATTKDVTSTNAASHQQASPPFSPPLSSPIPVRTDIILPSPTPLPSPAPSIPPATTPTEAVDPLTIGTIGVVRQALTAPCQVSQPDNGTLLPRFACIRVSTPTIINQPFTIEVTATDTDDNITAITLGTLPFLQANFMPQACVPAAARCTKTWTLQESQPGQYTYHIKAKNSRNQIVTYYLVVTVGSAGTTNTFIFRTAGVEAGPYHYNETYRYLDPLNVTILNEQGKALGSQVGKPFATFNLAANRLYVVNYSRQGYRLDADNLFFDEELPACTSLGCRMRRGNFTTTCDYQKTTADFECTVQHLVFNDSISFFYKPAGDSLGNNVIRVINPMYTFSSPIILRLPSLTLAEGSNHSGLDLDQYIIDDDTPTSKIQWKAEQEDYVSIRIDSEHVVTVTPNDKNFSGTDRITLTATDPEGNFDSAELMVTVTESDNDAPRITRYSPTASVVNITEGNNQTFSMLVEDSDQSPLQLFWTLDTKLALSQSLFFQYNATHGPSTHTLVSSVTDGTSSDAHTWTINELDTAPTAAFNYTPLDIIVNVTPVFFIDDSKAAFDPIVKREWNFGDGNTSNSSNPLYVFRAPGTYMVSLTVTDSDNSTNTVTKTIIVRSTMPRAAFNYTSQVVIANQSVVRFADSSMAESNPIVSWQWDFGDGSIDTNRNPSHVFQMPGNYTVTLTVTDRSGSRNTTSQVIPVTIDTTNPSVGTINVTPNPTAQGTTVTISVPVTDDAGIRSVVGEVTTPSGLGSFTFPLSLQNASSNIYNATFGNTSEVGIYSIRIIANDTSNNINDTQSAFFQITKAAGAGDTVVRIDTPQDGITLPVGKPFDLNATILPAGGSVTDCSAEVFFESNQSRLLVGQRQQPVGNLAPGRSASVSWRFAGIASGATRFDVLTTCKAGTQSRAFIVVFFEQDTLPPSVANVTVFPVAIEEGKSVTISASVRDNAAVDSVLAEITYPNLSTTLVRLNPTLPLSNALYSGVFSATTQAGTYMARIIANDTSNNINNTETATFYVVPPNGFGNVSVKIVTPPENSTVVYAQPFDITIATTAVGGHVFNCLLQLVSSDQTILAVNNLPFTIGNVLNGTTIATTVSGNASKLGVAGLTAYAVCGIAGLDKDSNDTVRDVRVELTVDNPPVIHNITLNPISLPQTGQVRIEANVTDDAGIDRVVAIITPPSGLNASTVRLASTAMPDIFAVSVFQMQEVGTYTITLVANDTKGQTSSRSVPLTITQVPGSGVTLTVIKTPADGAVLPPGQAFMVNASISAPAGISTACKATIYVNTSNLAVQGQAAKPLGDLATGTVMAVRWDVMPLRSGITDIFVLTTCDRGNQSLDKATIIISQDTLAPSVRDVTAMPIAIEQSFFVSLSANVTDNAQVDQVVFRITKPDATVMAFPATKQGNIYSAIFGFTDQEGLHTVQVVANDTAGNVNATESTVFFVVNPSTVGTVSSRVSAPANNSVFNKGSIRDVLIDLTAEGGDVFGCTVRLLPLDQTVITPLAPAVVLNITRGATVTARLQVNGTATGISDVVANTDCLFGGRAQSTLINLTVADTPLPVNQAPTVAISAPANNSMFLNGTQVNLTGTGTDMEDGILTGNRLAWTSSLDGVLGTGTSVNVSTLRIGNHTINLTGTDSNSVSSTISIIIQIVPSGTPVQVNVLPVVTITSPTNGSSFFFGTQVNFTGLGNDSEDGLLAGNSLVWTSSVNGSLSSSFGNGTSVNTTALGIGNHTITLTGTDSRNATASTAVVVEILPLPISPVQNQAPVVTLDNPINNAQVNNSGRVTFNATVVDDQALTLSCSLFVDNVLAQNNATIANATSFDFTVTNLGYGLHPWRIECNDGLATTASETRTLRIADTILPVITIASPVNDSRYLTSIVTLNYTVSDGESGINAAACAFRLDNGLPVNLASCRNSTLIVPDGSHQVTVFAADSFGNTNNASVSFRVNTNATITGFVVDNATSVLISGAVVRLLQGDQVIHLTTTGADGNYTFTIREGRYNLSVAAVGYVHPNEPLAVDLAANMTRVENVSLVPIVTTQSLVGYIYDMNHSIYGATVELSQNGVLIASAMTNITGQYAFPNVSVGRYNVTIFKPGYRVVEDAVNIVSGIASYDARLTPSSSIAGGVAGRVMDILGASVSNTIVYVYKSGTSDLVQVTIADPANSGGAYQFNGLPVIFTYDINATAPSRSFLFGPVSIGVEAGVVSQNNDVIMR